LKSVVPEIERSAAYKTDGLIAITFDQAPQSGPNADQSSCCGNPTYPNVPASTPPSSGASGSTTTGTTSTTSTSPTTSSGTTSTTSTTPTTSTGTTTTGTSTTTTAGTTTTTGTTTTSGTTTSPGALGGGSTNPTGGGGQVGMLLISKYVAPATFEVTDYFNHFALLASLEKLLGVPRIGYAADPALTLFGNAVYTKYTG
jgi:hypothetical protein